MAGKHFGGIVAGAMRQRRRGGNTGGKRFLSLIMVCFLLFAALPPAAAEEADAPLVALGNRVFYTVKEGEILLQSERLRREGSMTREELEQLRNNVVLALRDQAVLTLKYEELGLDREDPAQEAALEKSTREAFERSVEDLAGQLRKAYGGDEEKSLVTARALLDQTGITYEAMREQVYAQWKSFRLAEKVGGDIRVTEEELRALYEAEYVTPDREKYRGHPDAFEREILFGEGTSCYVPAEYRLVQWIELQPGEPAAGELKAAAAEDAESFRAAAAAYEATFGSFEKEEELQAARDAYDKALAGYAAAEEKLEKAKRKALEAVADTVTSIRQAYGEGAAWDDLTERYSSDQSTRGNPYPVFAESRMTDPVLRDTVMAIPSEGEISGPVCTEEGVLLIVWVRTVPEGAAEMGAETREALKNILRERKQAQRVRELLPGWRKEYEVRSWPERLAVSGN